MNAFNRLEIGGKNANKEKNLGFLKKQIVFALFFLTHCAFWMFKMAGWVWHLTSLKWKSRSCTKKREGSKGYVFQWRIGYPKPGFWIFKAFFFYILQKSLWLAIKSHFQNFKYSSNVSNIWQNLEKTLVQPPISQPKNWISFIRSITNNIFQNFCLYESLVWFWMLIFWTCNKLITGSQFVKFCFYVFSS